MKLALIVAISDNNVIGYKNGLAWHLPADLAHFKRITSGHHIIMGRKTYESIGRPLPNRISVVITRQEGYSALGCIVVHSLAEALVVAQHDTEPFVIGGAEIYAQALPYVHTLYITRVHQVVAGDIFFPACKWDAWYETTHAEQVADERNQCAYTFTVWERIKPIDFFPEAGILKNK